MGFWTWCAILGAAGVLVGLARRIVVREGHALVVAGVAVLALAAPIASWDARVQARAERALGPVVGVPGVQVACEDPFFGEFRLDTPDVGVRAEDRGDAHGTVRLDGSLCRSLDDYPARAGGGAALAVYGLTQGGRQVAGERDPAAASCWALQRMDAVAEHLGATPAAGAALQALFWQRYGRDLTRGLGLTAQCAEYGPWDLSPDDGRFP